VGIPTVAIGEKIQSYLTDIEPVVLTTRSSGATSLDPGEVGTLLYTYRDCQDKEDLIHDAADLRQVMRAVLQADNDDTMIEILQISRDEIPEAVNTLQRAFEKEVKRGQDGKEAMFEGVGIPSGQPASLCSAAGLNGTLTFTGTLCQEFLESAIAALMRMGKGTDLLLPPWTITKWEIDLDRRIGIGSFSAVYKGRWREAAVAIKVLSPTTPQKFFVHEVEIWKSLSHPNVLELLGASSASGEPPWFFVSPHMEHGSLDNYLKNVECRPRVNLLKMIYEVGLGMAYLHKRSVLHGDLKVQSCARVSVD